MNNPLKLLVEQPTYDVDIILEEKNKSEPRELFISGPYLMAEKKNKNGRVYSLDEMAKEVNRYTTEMIKNNRSIGELNHPTSVEVNPERACHIITEFNQNGNVFMGKSKILSNPMGQLVRSLMMDGVKLGISSRALGKLDEKAAHSQVSDFHLICCDVVHDPSVESAFVDGVLESKQWMLKCDGSVCEWVQSKHNDLQERVSKLPNTQDDKNKFLAEAVINFINELKNI
jgi:hypothetical protein